MARIRTIKPDFFLDEDLAKLSASHRLAFIGLWTQADREGRLEDRPKMLEAVLFPWDEVDFEAILCDLSPKFLHRYETGGKRYIQIVQFAKHQRPHMREAESTIPAEGKAKAQPRQCSSTIKAGPGPLDKGKGKEGNGEGAMSVEADDFDEFYRLYPRKVSPADARKAWSKLAPSSELRATIMAAIKSQRLNPDWARGDGKFIPYPASWINGRRWEDQGVTLPKPSLVPDAATAAHLAARGLS